jgi:pimeloyl-ACP methyl ester carboxylesterase
MTENLICEIKKLFPENKLIVFSTSWGSILSLKLLEKNPYVVDAVIASGQIIKSVFLCDEVLDALKETNIAQKKLERIRNITPDNFEGKDLQLISSSLRKYTNAYENKNGEKVPIGKIIMGLLKSPDYKFKDFKAIMANGYMKNKSLWKEILKLDLSENLLNVKIPYICLQGDTDIVASTRTINELVNNSNNSLLECIVVENTGHMPSKTLMDKLMYLLKEKMSNL